MDLATRIRTELADGKPPEQMVAELVASGMSHPTAQRLVDRAVATPAPPASAPTDDDKTADDPGGQWALVRGTFFFSLGVTITAVTYYLAKPGQKYTVTYGLVAAGIVGFAHGFRRWLKAEHATFPAVLVLVALGLPMLAGTGLAWYKREPTMRERAMRALEDTEAANEARHREEEAKRKEDEAAKKLQIQKSMIELGKGVDALQLLIDPSPEVRCQGARYFGNQKSPGGYSDDELLRLVDTDPEMSVRRCGIDALVAIGSTTRLLRVLDRLAEYEGFREVVVYGLDQVTNDPGEADQDLLARVRAKVDAR